MTAMDRSLLCDAFRSKTEQEILIGEEINCHQAAAKYLTKRPTRDEAPFDLTWARQLHGEMLGNVWLYAGQFRLSPINVKSRANLGVHPSQIELQLFDLFADLHYWYSKGSFPLLEQAARLHHRAVFIHPFVDGNGRWSRLLANIWLLQHGETVIAWPFEMRVDRKVGSPIRSQYLQALAQADKGDHEPFIRLHAQYQKD